MITSDSRRRVSWHRGWAPKMPRAEEGERRVTQILGDSTLTGVYRMAQRCSRAEHFKLHPQPRVSL